jgi:hypothetical protein
MKNILTFIALFTCVFSYGQGSLNGQWQIDASKTFTFHEDMTFSQLFAGKNYAGTYTFEGNGLVFKYPQGDKKYTITAFEDNKIVIANAQKTQQLSLTKVVESSTSNDVMATATPTKNEPKILQEEDHNVAKSQPKQEVNAKHEKTKSSRLNLATQYDINRMRVGIKLLLPGIAGLHTEYVLPIMKNNVAATFDYSNLPGKWFSDSGAGVNFGYWKVGANYYFSNSGSGTGFYGGLHYQKLIGSLSDINLGVGGFGGVLGFKTKGRVFFGAEIGLSKADIDIIAENGKNYGYIPNLNFSFGVAFL